MLSEKKLAVVSKELPTSHMALQSENSTEFMSSVLQAINSMLLDMLAAIRKDYEDRRNRQMQGIARANTEDKYSGRMKDSEKRKIIANLLKSGHSYTEMQATAKCSRQLIAVTAKQILKYSNTQILKYSNTQILKYSNTQILKIILRICNNLVK